MYFSGKKRFRTFVQRIKFFPVIQLVRMWASIAQAAFKASNKFPVLAFSPRSLSRHSYYYVTKRFYVTTQVRDCRFSMNAFIIANSFWQMELNQNSWWKRYGTKKKNHQKNHTMHTVCLFFLGRVIKMWLKWMREESTHNAHCKKMLTPKTATTTKSNC